ncbi:hypothetical protein [Homoserinibacter gongjuensis]|uniref:ABC transporter permease n=1 Tax=Homoserinibacter gongjuensis TaxID=1162968 RepID=A0ABQ6JXB8_9MICO|nr:hypothetical protein [Homoserinibacter gongjuensis]GMA91925.1 hypothetical protein GCM10025869_24540 [Homoserinibacter gongjuensis]
MRYLIASLWLAMARVEVLQQRYSETRRRFDDRLTRWTIPQLFDLDLKADEASVGQIDPQFARAAVENRSLRIDTRVLIISTVVAGLTGGLLGLIAALLTMAAGGGA